MFNSLKLLFVLAIAVFMLHFHSAHAAQKFTRSQAFGDWVLKCSKDNDPKAKNSKEKCSLQQSMVNEKRVRVLAVSIVKVAKRAEKLIVFALPLGFYLPDGVKVTVDKGKPRNLLVTNCTQSGCNARISLDKKLSKELYKGEKLKITLFTGDRTKKLDFAVSLKGISGGVKAVK
jgi:invasion protein IalB